MRRILGGIYRNMGLINHKSQNNNRMYNKELIKNNKIQKSKSCYFDTK